MNELQGKGTKLQEVEIEKLKGGGARTSGSRMVVIAVLTLSLRLVGIKERRGW